MEIRRNEKLEEGKEGDARERREGMEDENKDNGALEAHTRIRV